MDGFETGREKSPCNLGRIIYILSISQLLSIFSVVEPEQVALLCREKTYAAQQAIYKQGYPSDKLYILVDGAVSLIRLAKTCAEAAKMMITVDISEPGQVFGCTALVGPHVHTASAICCRETTLLAINGSDLRPILEKDYLNGFEAMMDLASPSYL